MSKSYHILRIGLGITFVWVGIFILNDPAGWAGFIRPWAQNLIPFSPENFMRFAGMLDIGLGALLVINVLPKILAWVSVLHLAGILIVSGIDAVTVRDIGLLGAALSLAFWPDKKDFDSAPEN